MLTTVFIVGAAVAASLIAVFAFFAERQSRRRRRSLKHIARPPAPDIAYRAVVNARSAFTRSVQAYEEALASAGADAASISALPGDSQTSTDLAVIERRKEMRRTRLLEAQRMWEDVRPAIAPASTVPVWIGAGELRGWSLGVLGHEVAFLRVEHAFDPSCWVVLETRRVRIGPALGAERVELGIVIEGSSIDQLTALVREAMGSSEIAFRPGTLLARLLSKRNEPARRFFASLRDQVDAGSRVYVNGLGGETRQAGLAYLSASKGLDLDGSAGGLRDAFEQQSLQIDSAGPALLFGLWTGRKPSARILAGSNHQAWLRSSTQSTTIDEEALA